jgi:cyclopropane fatty-acyl-phospholipid synthase-like methyltransferase
MVMDRFNNIVNHLFDKEKIDGGINWANYQTFSPLNHNKGRNTDLRIEKYKLYNYLKDTDEVLDIGCNTGFIDLTIADKVKNVLGIEYEQKLVNIANQVKDYMEIKNVEFQQADFNKFETDKKFDFIFSFAVHHWIGMDLDLYGEKIYNLLKQNGRVIFETQNINDLNFDTDYEIKIERFVKNRFKIIRGDFLYQKEATGGANLDRYFCILEKI